jgi:hypothetical protein
VETKTRWFRASRCSTVGAARHQHTKTGIKTACAMLLLLSLVPSAAMTEASGIQSQAEANTKVSRPARLYTSGSAQAPESGIGDRPQLEQRANPTEAITSGNWVNLYPPLSAVSAASATDAWAIGDKGYLLHFMNGSWQPVAADNSWNLTDIDMVSPTSGWVSASKPGTNAALEYNGTNWVERSTGTLRLGKISAVSANNVWALANFGRTIAQWDGAQWIDIGLNLPSGTSLSDIYLLNATEGWAVGTSRQSGTDTPLLYRFDGSTWSSFSTPMATGHLSRVASSSPGVVWATGYDRTTHEYYIYRYSAGTWTGWVSPMYDESTGIVMISATEGYVTTWESIIRWDGSSWTMDYTGQRFADIDAMSGQIWAVGGGATVLSRAGSGPWTKQHGGPTSYSLHAVWAAGMNDAWAVGDYISGYGPAILRYIGGTWQRVAHSLNFGNLGSLYDVEMASSAEGYAVGFQGIVRWDGTQWTRVAQFTGTLYGMSLPGPGQGWAVGSSGQIWQNVNGTWNRVTSPMPTSVDLLSVHMDSPSHGWAVGYQRTSPYGGKLLEYNGSEWIDQSSLVPSGVRRLTDVRTDSSGQNGWAVGSWQGTRTTNILRLTDGVWSADPYTDASHLSKVSLEALGEAWAIGCAAAFHYTGGEWASVALPSSMCLDGMALIPGQGGWAVGYNGTILKYDPLMDGRRYYDVAPTSTFYEFIECMATRGIISGYADNTFRPNNNVTRGQLAKIVSNSAGYAEPPGAQMFEDVPPGSPFYDWVQRLASRGHISGYACGGADEPCIPPSNLPYFRPNTNTTRGQISKVVSNAAGFTGDPTGQSFEDVPVTNTFYVWIERLASRGIMSGYNCGGPGEPCGPQNLPYFRWQNNATRGQSSKIVANSFFPGCQNP